MNSTFTETFISQASKGSSKNLSLYFAARDAGKAIAEQTKKGEIILLAKKSGQELYAAFIGAILVGRIPLVIQRPSPKVHQSFFEKRITDLKDQINATICFCEPQDVEKFQPHFTCLTEMVSLASHAEPPIYIPDENDIAFIQMSSGTTGRSKICEITHKQILSHCRAYGKVIGMDATKCVVSWLPLYHDMGLVAAFLLPIIHDAEFHIIDPFEWLMLPITLLRMAADCKATHCWMPSFSFNYLTNKVGIEALSKYRLDSLERVISCSEPTFCDDLTKFQNHFAAVGLKPTAVSVCYALAENVFAVSQSDGLEETDWKGAKYASCGKLIPDVSVKVVKNGEDVTGVDDGTVMLKSIYEPNTNTHDAKGYYNTGDIGFLKDGNLYIIGREKDMFASYGVNVYPEMVEHLIANIEGVIPGRVVCFGVFDKVLGTNRIIALAETNTVGNNILRTELSTIIKEEFNLTAIVKLVEPGVLIKTSSGKFCRIKNKEQYAKG